MKKILRLLVAIPSALVLITLALINRQPVTLSLDPFNTPPALALPPLPFYVFLLGGLMLGVALGGIVTWINQGHWRRQARNRKVEARRWQAEADRLTQERDASLTAGKAGGSGRQLVASGRG
jgi:uncharacterized integral membrane protein